jgi:hypothetical protein
VIIYHGILTLDKVSAVATVLTFFSNLPHLVIYHGILIILAHDDRHGQLIYSNQNEKNSDCPIAISVLIIEESCEL